MNLSQRWRVLRAQSETQGIIVALLVVVIIVFAVIAAIHRGYLTADDGIFLACFVPAVMIHEVSHGVVALWCGDTTAKDAGRLTLNPLKHVDPFGSIVMPIIMQLTVHYPWGWAKPVPVSINKLRRPRNDAVLVGLAGPGVNILMACLAGVVIHFLWTGNQFATFEGNFTTAGIWFYTFGIVNVLLAAFNLIPIPPLDGSALIERLIPAQYLGQYYQLRFAFMAVVLLVVLTQQATIDNYLFHVENWYLNLWL